LEVDLEAEVENSRSIDRSFAGAAVLRRMGRPIAPVMVGERYELVREIGWGGYGRVYEAIDHELSRRVAVKVLDLGDREFALREGQLLAEFLHPNVVMIFDYGVGPDYRYFVMQLLDGPTLREWCGDKSPAKIVRKFVEAANGLAAVHAQGLVHRDFKPSNVRIGPQGQAVLVDFGLARHLDTLNGDPNEVGVFAGTIDHAAPERLLGLPHDDRSDQFSLCVALWEALSGVNPFGRCNATTTPDQRVDAFRSGIAGTPRGGRRVARVVRRGLSLEPADRFPSMDAMTAAIAPDWWRWAWRVLLAMAVGVVTVSVLLISLMLFVGGASFEFVANAQARCWGQVAIVVAGEGNVDGAMWRLESAKRAELSKETSRELALATEAVAAEFERHVMYKDAQLAWMLATFFARDAGDLEIEQRAMEHAKLIARAR
jgi:hypothetical protein